AVVDNVLALVVIGTVYTKDLRVMALGWALVLFAVILVLRVLGVHRGLPYLLPGTAPWVAVFESGVDPIIVGLVLGLMTYAYPAGRSELERATELFRSF